MAASAQLVITLTIGGPLERDDLAGLFERACALLEHTRPRGAPL